MMDPSTVQYYGSYGGPSADQETVEDIRGAIEQRTDAYDTFSTVASLIFGFGVSIMFDAMKDEVIRKWHDVPAIAFTVLGVIVVTGSFLPTIVLPFRAGMVRRILALHRADGSEAEWARDFVLKTSHMTQPCMIGLIGSCFALLLQVVLLVVMKARDFNRVAFGGIGMPIVVLALVWTLQMTFHKVSSSSGSDTSAAFNTAPQGAVYVGQSQEFGASRPPKGKRQEEAAAGNEGEKPLLLGDHDLADDAAAEQDEEKPPESIPEEEEWSVRRCWQLQGKDGDPDSIMGKGILFRKGEFVQVLDPPEDEPEIDPESDGLRRRGALGKPARKLRAGDSAVWGSLEEAIEALNHERCPDRFLMQGHCVFRVAAGRGASGVASSWLSPPPKPPPGPDMALCYLAYTSEEAQSRGLAAVRGPLLSPAAAPAWEAVEEFLRDELAPYLELHRQGLLADTELLKVTTHAFRQEGTKMLQELLGSRKMSSVLQCAGYLRQKGIMVDISDVIDEVDRMFRQSAPFMYFVG